MSPRLFYQQLILLSAVVMAVILLLSYFPVFKASFNYSIVSLCFFISLSIFIYYLAKSASTSHSIGYWSNCSEDVFGNRLNHRFLQRVSPQGKPFSDSFLLCLHLFYEFRGLLHDKTRQGQNPEACSKQLNPMLIK
jgi:hypothetical protein